MNHPVFINTRPNAHYQIDGVTVFDLPLLELSTRPLADDELHLLSRLIQGRFKAVIAVSVMAVTCAMSWLKKQGICHVRDLKNPPAFIAVGNATGQALKEWGITPIIPDTQNNEGMLELPIIKHLSPNDDILIWRGVGGRRLLADTLIKRDIGVHAVAFYERKAPPYLLQRFHELLAILSDPPPQFITVLISSEASLNAWRDVCQKNAPDGMFSAKNVVYLTLGERLTTLTSQYYPDFGVWRIEDLDKATLHQALHAITTQSQ